MMISLWMTCGALAQSVWVVDSSDPAAFQHVQDAIDVASSGDTVQVLPGIWGVYDGSLKVVGKDLTILGTGCGQVELMGTSAATLTIEDVGSAVVRDLTIRAEAPFRGAEVRRSVAQFSDVCFMDLGDGTIAQGAGVDAEDSDLTFDKVLFSKNRADQGGAVAVLNGPDRSVVFSGGTLEFNTADVDHGGAVYLDGGTLKFEGTVLTGNQAGADGGAIFSVNHVGDLMLTNATLADNAAADDAGAASIAGDALIQGTSFSSNVAADHGGAVASQAGKLKVLQSTFAGNTGTTGGGFFVASGDLVMVDVIAKYNSAATGGAGAMETAGGSAAITGGAFTENTASGSGGALSFNAIGVVVDGNTSFTQNIATELGGAIVHSYGGDLVLTGIAFTENRARSGGAVWSDSHDMTNLDLVQVHGSSFLDNEAVGGAAGTSGADGGALFVGRRGQLDVDASRFVGNRAGGTSGIQRGGALRGLDNDDVSVTNSFFCGNAATQGSAALSQTSVNQETWNNNVVVSNNASTGYAALFLNQPAALDFSSNTLLANTGSAAGSITYFVQPGSSLVTDANVVAYDPSSAAISNSMGGLRYPTEVVAGWGSNACHANAGPDFAFSPSPACPSGGPPVPDPTGIPCDQLTPADFEIDGEYAGMGADPYQVPIP